MRKERGAIKYVVAAAVAAVAGIVGFVAWSVQAKRAEHREITALVHEASGGLAEALKQPSAEHAAKLQAAAERLQALRVERQKVYAEAADVYLVSARTIAQRQADAVRVAAEARRAREALVAHMRGPRGRNDAWIRQAAELSKRADQAFAEYVRVQEALIELLRTLPEAEKQLEPYAGPGIADPALHQAALQRAEEELKRARAEDAAARRVR